MFFIRKHFNCVVKQYKFVWLSLKELNNCQKKLKFRTVIHRIVSGGYYGFHFVTLLPPPLPQCVERLHYYHSNKKNIIDSLLKFAGYIHNHKILSLVKSAYISLIIGPRVLGW